MSISVSGWKRVPPDIQRMAFEFWVETGSMTKAAKRLEALGKVNSHNKPYAISQVSAQANIYILENFKTVDIRGIVDTDRERLGLKPMTDQEWEEFLVLKAVALWATKGHVARFWDWIDENDFYRYEKLWKHHNISPRPSNQPKR